MADDSTAANEVSDASTTESVNQTQETLGNLTDPDWWSTIDWIDIASELGTWVLIVVVAWFIGGVIAGTVRRGMDKSKRQPSAIFKSFVITWIRRSVVILGMVIAFGTVGIDIAPIIAGLGVFGFVIGFAVQGTLSNFASGIMLLIYQPFDEGDVVEVDGIIGKVSALSVVNTTLITGDNREVIVPNSNVWGSTIINYTRQSTRRIDLIIGVGYGADLQKTKEVLRKVLADDEGILEEPASKVEVFELADSSVNFVVRPWVKTEEFWDVRFRLLHNIKDALDANDIEIPFPQRVVHLVKDE